MAAKPSKRPKTTKTQRASRTPFRLEVIRIAEYMISGGLYFWTGYIVFFVCDSFFGWSLWWAKLTANLIGWTVNYVLQRFWVFRNPDARHKVEVTGRYIVITLVDFVLDYAIVKGLQTAGITPYIGQFVSAGFFTIWNYFWYRSWVFANRVHRPPHASKSRKAKQARRGKK